MEVYLEDNRPTIDEVCMEYEDCIEDVLLYEFCHSKKAGTPREDYEPLYNCENWIP